MKRNKNWGRQGQREPQSPRHFQAFIEWDKQPNTPHKAELKASARAQTITRRLSGQPDSGSTTSITCILKQLTVIKLYKPGYFGTSFLSGSILWSYLIKWLFPILNRLTNSPNCITVILTSIKSNTTRNMSKIWKHWSRNVAEGTHYLFGCIVLFYRDLSLSPCFNSILFYCFSLFKMQKFHFF